MFEKIMAMAASVTDKTVDFLGDNSEKIKNIAGAVAGIIGIGVAVKGNRNKTLEKAVLLEQYKATKRANDLFDEAVKADEE